MTYTIYADMAVLWSFAINYALIYFSDRIMGYKANFKHIALYSFIISFLCTAEYIIFINQKLILQDILYVLTYILLLYIYYRLRYKTTNYIYILMIYIFISLLFAVLLSYLKYSFNQGKTYAIILFISLFMIIPSIYISYIISYKKIVIDKNTYQISICIRNQEFITYAYYDTGNILTDNYGRKVIITDIDYAKHLLGENYIEILNNYKKENKFDYKKANLISGTRIYPIACHTIVSDFTLIPGFKIDKLCFKSNGIKYSDITVGISKNALNLGENIHILLNDNLKPHGF